MKRIISLMICLLLLCGLVGTALACPAGNFDCSYTGNPSFCWWTETVSGLRCVANTPGCSVKRTTTFNDYKCPKCGYGNPYVASIYDVHSSPNCKVMMP